jgi:DNA-binding transcriptional MerR regulator
MEIQSMRRPDKGGVNFVKDKDLLSIRQFSQLTGIRQSKLRYYDEIKLFQPIQRGENGYRYYSAQQVIAANCIINVMTSLHLPIKRVLDLKKQRTPKHILGLLKKHEFDLNQTLFGLQQAYALVHTYSSLIQEGLLADEQSVGCQWMDALPIELGSVNDFSSGYFYDSFFSFTRQMSERKIDVAYPIGGYYSDVEAFTGTPGWPTRFFSCIPTGQAQKAEGEYLVGYTRGYYGNLGDLPQRLMEYASASGYDFIGPVYEIYLHDAISVDDPNQYLIQISIPVKKR